MTTINIRTDKNLKKVSKEILDEMGLDMSGAITLFLQQVVITKSIPFSIKSANGFSPSEEAQLLREKKKMKEAIKKDKVKLYASAEDLTRDLLR